MFTLRFAPGVCCGYTSAIIRAATVGQLIGFADAFAEGQCGALESGWIERDGRFVSELYDWALCWYSGPIPMLAEIIAPPGFQPDRVIGP